MLKCSPLRYPGGKGKMYRQTVQLIEDNNLNGCTYVEPFAGGANLALGLLFNEQVNNIILNDLDVAIYAFWHSVINRAPELIELIRATDISIQEWRNQKNIYQNERVDLLALGFSVFFLNRTNRSGIISAGPIGGYQQNGNYLMDCRFNKEDLIARITRIYEYRESIEVCNLDAREFLNRNFDRNTFLFIDPPYYDKGSLLYKNALNHQDHIEISNLVRDLDVPWVVTYDNADEIIGMYNFSNSKLYNLRYSVENKRLGTEVVFYPNDLIVNF